MAEGSDQSGGEDNLSCLIEDTVISLQTNVKCEKAAKIQAAVKSCISMFFAEVTKMEPMFKPTELIQVGSYAEGTKILQPDEFDFLVVIDELSRPGAVAIDNNLDKIQGVTKLPQSGYVTLMVADEKLKPKWEKYCDNGLLQCFQQTSHLARFPTDRDRFGSVFVKVVRNYYKERVIPKKTNAMVTWSSIEIDFINCALGLPPFDDIALYLKRVEFKIPNILINLELDGLEISADLSPAIRYHKILDCFKPEDCAGSALSEHILRRESLLLVANLNFDFRVTVTEAEVDYMQHIMKNEHKVIYIFLKYINNSFSTKNCNCEAFSSYMLKNICFMHDLNCQHKIRTIFSCFEDVIAAMNECCLKKEITSAVNSKIVWADKDKMESEYREHVVLALRQIYQQSEDIHTLKDFRELLNDAVETHLKGFRHEMNKKNISIFRELWYMYN